MFSKMEDKKEFRFKRLRDDPVVEVRGNIDRAIRILRKKVQLCGNHKVLNIRRRYPSRKDRRRAKDLKATQRARRVNNLMARVGEQNEKQKK